MEYKLTKSGYVVHLQRGEEIFSSLLDFARKEKVGSAWINGLGGVDEAELGFYDLAKKDYLRKQLKEELELVQVVGNLAHHDGKPVLHMHATLGDDKFQTYSGHLFSGKISIVGEFFVIPLSIDLKRSFNDFFRLNLIDI